ncbi:hypothetical protein F4818DRAFT_423132 [Hypoxylon cercidicola]|nr:hypothetical protein F4818DRAFT_423132 [Hypoxylon cercidicola]
MKTSFVLATIASAVAMVGAVAPVEERAYQSVSDIVNSMKLDPHGTNEVTKDNRILSYDKNHNVIDEKTASPQAVADWRKGWKPLMAMARDTSRRSDEELFDLAKRAACGAFPCEDRFDCRAVNCYGGCWPNENDLDRCYP